MPKMSVVYVSEQAPMSYRQSLFLAGPTPRSPDVPSWRPEALHILTTLGYEGVVFVPEWRDGSRHADYTDQIEWEERHLHMADGIAFWIPRSLETLPGFTTNVEFGIWMESGKAVLGTPAEAPEVRYLRHYAEKLCVPTANTLTATLEAALAAIGDGAERTGGEREIPLLIWKTPHFQSWYLAQKQAGNRLDSARVVFTFRVGPDRRFVLFWALHVDIYVASEDRHKTNEVVLSRPDIATVMMYLPGDTARDTKVILIREFRTTAETRDGMVHELPGGASLKPQADPLDVATQECRSETGLSLKPERVRRHEARQLASTVTTHQAHLFSVELRPEEFDQLLPLDGEQFGDNTETERTYIEIRTLDQILKTEDVDWSTLGMILRVIAGEDSAH
jgi:8-oxo-dGTP pyrophosphatase MutT (NUDIX family)